MGAESAARRKQAGLSLGPGVTGVANEGAGCGWASRAAPPAPRGLWLPKASRPRRACATSRGCRPRPQKREPEPRLLGLLSQVAGQPFYLHGGCAI